MTSVRLCLILDMHLYHNPCHLLLLLFFFGKEEFTIIYISRIDIMICLVHQKVKKNIKKSGYSNCIKNDSHKSLVYCIICLPSLISCI